MDPLQPCSDSLLIRGNSPVADDNMRSIYRRRLNSLDYEVRLLELYAPSSTDSRYSFKCRLKYRSLKDSPEYIALSYCWGDMRDKQKLPIEGRIVQISHNLLVALQQLWRLGLHLVWVDYLCINQKDNEEKSSQVRMMDTIYAKASTVFAWLGPESHDSDLAMTMLGAPVLGRQVELPEEVDVACDAVIRLLSRPYFGRMWIIQELCRARDPVLLCGRRFVPWPTMLERLDKLGRSVPAQYARHLIAPLREMRYRDQYRFRANTETGLIQLLVMSRRSLALDPRDKLYALLSLAKDGRVLIPTPNYSQSVEHIFWDTARCMIEDHDRTDIILLANRTRGERDLPSWVPDWANLKSQPPPWLAQCLAEGRGMLRTRNRVRGGILEVRGTPHSKISDLLGFEDHDQKTAINDPRQDLSRFESIVVNLCMGLTIGVEANYSMRAAVRAMLGFCNHIGSHQEYEGSRLASWMYRNRHRKIGVSALQEYLYEYLKRIPSNGPEDEEAVNRARSEMGQGFERLERLRMLFAATTNGAIRIVYYAANVGDEIYTLLNCPLPVILRPVNDGRFQYIGEVFASQQFQAAARKGETQILTIE